MLFLLMKMGLRASKVASFFKSYSVKNYSTHFYLTLCQMELKDCTHRTALTRGSGGLKLSPWFLNSLPHQEAVAE